ncbi:MAG: hypothetical protein HY855_07750 [Burkholderiales bacterium]|nr:hypothetical protein [Burkholderiales bacterium]
MRWKLLRRRLSVSAPRMIVRRHLPWPLRWAVVALALGFSAAIALWAFEFGKNLAGLDQDAKQELARLRQDVGTLRQERDKAQSFVHAAESLLKAERAAQEKLAQQVRQLEATNMALQADLGFFERLLPASAGEGLAVRGLQVEPQSPGRLRYQVLLMQSRKGASRFNGRYEFLLAGTLDGKPWTATPAGGNQPLQLRQYLRVEGQLEVPPGAVVKTVHLKVTDEAGALCATQTLRL